VLPTTHRSISAALAVGLLLAGVLAGCAPQPTAPVTGSKPATQTPPPPGPAAELAAPGAKLAQVNVPPAELIARLSYVEKLDGDSWDIAFEPYGYGPQRGDARTVVAKVGRTNARDDENGRLAIDGENATLVLGSGVDVPEGGSYTGVVKLVKSADGLDFVLTSAQRD